ncbi:MAG: hypothetical protein AAF411_21590 [Myxococcota bacterium]
MEVTLLNRSPYTIPSKQRVDAIVFDGDADMQLWPGPGHEAELKEHYGDGLQRALDAELRQVPRRLLEIPSVIRVSPGRLHCNFLGWIATRSPSAGRERSPAPSIDVIREGVRLALEFASKRDVERIAIGTLGAGPNEAPRLERMVAIAEAAQAWADARYKRGERTPIEEVFVCEPSGAIYRQLKTRTRDFASAPEAPPAPKRAAAPRRRSATKSKAKSTAKKKVAGLTSVEVLAHRGAAKYSMRTTYAEGDFFLHPKFGVGKVLSLPAAGQIECAFEDGSTRKLVHGR